MDERIMMSTGAPPPPSEVKVRTMRSDLESMARSGGGSPKFQNVEINGLATEKEYSTPSHAPSMASVQQPAQTVSAPTVSQPVTTPIQSTGQPQIDPQNDAYPIFIVAIVAILAIIGVGYFAYITFFTGTPVQTPTAPVPAPTPVAALPLFSTTTTQGQTSSSSVSTSTTTAAVTPASAELTTQHVSLFTKPADQIITVSFGTTNSTTYRKTMAGSLGAVNAASTVIELNTKANDGNSLSIQGLLSISGGTILNTQALASFAADATFFIYRDNNGLWPGYVLALNPGQTTSSVMTNVKQLETSNNISSLYLQDPGTASSDGFTDSKSAGVNVRILPFTSLTIPAYFTYGWYKNHLILSTSKNGFVAATANF